VDAHSVLTPLNFPTAGEKARSANQIEKRKSVFRGVCWVRKVQKWTAYISNGPSDGSGFKLFKTLFQG